MPFARRRVHAFQVLILFAAALLTAGCGGGSSSSPPQPPPTPPSGPNVQPIAVNGGPVPAQIYPNGVFTTVTVCVPNTSTCQAIGGILVDTGSYGLRLLSSAGGGALTLSLPQETDARGNPIDECVKFADLSYIWGPVQTADIKISGEQASSVPVQVIDPVSVVAPTTCSSVGGLNDGSLLNLGANGILGVGAFQQDCGPGCTPAGNPNPIPGTYYTCPTSPPSSPCLPAFASLAQQVQNPVALFSGDNNGVILELPSVSSTGATTATGSMVFGIATRTDNTLGGANILTLDGFGNFTTVFHGQSYTSSFIDSGSNALFFADTVGLPTCVDLQNDFYCPNSVQTFPATNQGMNGASSNVSFNVANADSLFSTSDAAFSDLGGPAPGSVSGAFDWGLPFFYGRNVYVAIEGKTVSGAPSGPFWAY